MFSKATRRLLLPLPSPLTQPQTPGKKSTFHQQRLITSGLRDATLAQDITYTGA